VAARSARAGAIAVASQVIQLVIGVTGTVILARLLNPADYGLVAMATVLVSFAAIFKDLGLSEATVQRPSLTHEQCSTLFWINLGLGAVSMLLVAAAAPVVVWFYDIPALGPITLALSLAFPIGALAAQHAALLRRQMRFVALASSDLVAVVVGSWSLRCWPGVERSIGRWSSAGWPRR
jgi:O-antigen/teichoic acid export membrane protein